MKTPENYTRTNQNSIGTCKVLSSVSIVLILLFFYQKASSQMIIAPRNKLAKSTLKPGKPLVPIRKVSSGGVIHRFHDTSPLSPSGRYLALFRVPFEEQYTKPGDAGEVILVDLKTNHEKVLAKSYGWEMQLGANVQWGATDDQLFYNDVDTKTWNAFTVELNPFSGKKRILNGTVFMASLDGEELLSYNLINSIHAQPGYGVVIPDSLTNYNIGPVDSDSLFTTNTRTGKVRKLATIRDIYEKSIPSIAVPNPNEYSYYLFKAMWNPQKTRIMTLVMMKPLTGAKRRIAVITMLPDGSDIRTAITPEQYAKGGHHMAWTADGEHISMNLNVDGKPGVEIITVKYDGTELKTVYPIGSGHPSYHPGGLPLVITDSYWHEPITNKDGFVPLRLINTETGTEQLLASVYVPITDDSLFRVDLHPTWDRSGRYIIFNAFEDNTRCVFIADLKDIVDKIDVNN